MCVLEDWLSADADPSDAVHAYEAWYAWVTARYDYLRAQGYSSNDAQFIAASGEFPRRGAA